MHMASVGMFICTCSAEPFLVPVEFEFEFVEFEPAVVDCFSKPQIPELLRLATGKKTLGAPDNDCQREDYGH
jgi:hypothetical protein